MSVTQTGKVVRAIIVLPLNVAVTVPSVIVITTEAIRWPEPWATVALAFGGLLIGLGLVGLARTIRLFAGIGGGTLASWDSTRKLVVVGPYRFVRNPMISSVLAILLGESLAVGSMWLLAWAAFFLTANLVYIRLFEERGLVERFGTEYEEYRRNVPAWFPRLTPWQAGDDSSDQIE